ASSGPLMRRLNGYRLGAGDLWNHSVATAVASQWLAQALHYPNPEEAYVGGLLHDIGKLMLDQYVLVDYTKIVDLMRRYNLSLWQVEEQVIGIDHATVGSMMAEKWNYPVILVDAIHYHHAPSLARVHPELPAIINVANAWSSRQSPASQEIFVQSIHPESLQILRLSEERLERFQEEMTAYMIGS
ncbi:MAG: HDOD domain-containing protein, partial [Chloroflexi bacterium]|nr:HDOD domain-containing protein [Chloroflexota bacterium]